MRAEIEFFHTDSEHVMFISERNGSAILQYGRAGVLGIGARQLCQSPATKPTNTMDLRINTGVALFFVLSAFLPRQSFAQSGQEFSPQQLTKKIADMDSVLFHAFNTCNVTLSKALFTEDLEFYHDAGGLTNYAQNVRSIEQRCSGETKVRRELVKGSLEVFPIKGYGAIQTGSHRFYYTGKGQEEKLDGTFKFVHIWKNINGTWKIARVISYDH